MDGHGLRAPTLPLELERDIFEVAALSSHSQAATLMLVSKRVKQWVEPYIYRMVLVGGPTPNCANEDKLFLSSKAKPQLFIETAVRHFFLLRLQGLLAEWTIRWHGILALSTGVTNLFSNVPFEGLLPILGNMHSLSQLAVNIGLLFHGAPIDFTHNLFCNITHLEAFDIEGDCTVWIGLSHITTLTHFSCSNDHLLSLAEDILARCQSLQRFIYICNGTEYGPAAPSTAKVVDSCFAVITLDDAAADWEKGVLLGKDYWRPV
ncbi:hypothetical protein B0H13DRAFT_2354404 [Mycena leptocephala]|nr:hypothetical protein B0H13DRAFT_2354404 [Mycena leptocephala]